jgi:hypothetical protein
MQLAFPSTTSINPDLRGNSMTRKGRNYRDKEPQDRAADYPVGYGKPPLASRFKRGTSGNAKGRPKGSKNLKTLIRDAMTASISIQEGAKTKRVSRIEGVVLRQLQKALMGSDQAAMAVVKMALQLGFLEGSTDNFDAVALTRDDEQILSELIARSRKD